MMNTNHYCVIMAGGIGSRFWPLSRNAKPKQFLDIMGVGRTFIQMTFDRFSQFIPVQNFLVVTGVEYQDLVLEQLPQLKREQVLLESERRNTAPCIAYSTYKLKKVNPEAVVVFTPADHLILHEDRFKEIMLNNLNFAEKQDVLVTTGICPTFPATGYGYIEVETKGVPISKVKAFKEKPNLETAQQFLETGRYLWNSGMFVCSAESMKKALESELPDIAEAFAAIEPVYNTKEEQAAVDRVFSHCRSISIDYGVFEKVKNAFVAASDFGWSDVGTWGSLYQLSEKDEASNASLQGELLSFDSVGCLVKQMNHNKLVVIDSLQNFLVVDDKDVLMICPREDEQKIKELIEKVVKEKNRLK